MIFLVVIFLELHGPNGQVVEINPDEISSLRVPQAGSEHHFAKGTHCLVQMTNGNINAVAETCQAILQTLKENHNAK
jgi:hypothetical protein